MVSYIAEHVVGTGSFGVVFQVCKFSVILNFKSAVLSHNNHLVFCVHAIIGTVC